MKTPASYFGDRGITGYLCPKCSRTLLWGFGAWICERCESSLLVAASWVILKRATGNIIAETYDERQVKALNTERYVAVPILQYFTALAKAEGRDA